MRECGNGWSFNNSKKKQPKARMSCFMRCVVCDVAACVPAVGPICFSACRRKGHRLEEPPPPEKLSKNWCVFAGVDLT